MGKESRKSHGRMNPECPQACLAGPFFDGELDAVETTRYLDHLSHCASCRAELREVRRVSQLLRNNGRLEPWAPGPEDALEAAAEAAEQAEAVGGKAERGAGRRPSPLKPHPNPASGLAVAPAGGGGGGRA